MARRRLVAALDVAEDESIVEKAKAIRQMGLRSKDALHIACAISAGCRYFLTTDNTVLRAMRDCEEIKVMNPTQFVVTEGES